MKGRAALNRIAARLRTVVFLASHGYRAKVNVTDAINGFYGNHRGGWNLGLNALAPLHHPMGILLDGFIERTFAFHPLGIKPHLEPWIGFIHVPPNVPEWFPAEQSNTRIFESDAWKQSVPYCRGIFALSEYHAKALESLLDVPVGSLLLPTVTPELKWTWDRFAANRERRIVQIGTWLRRLHSIFLLPTRSYRKTARMPMQDWTESTLRREREILEHEATLTREMLNSVEFIERHLSNKEYDDLLSENVVFLDLYDSSANNAIVECIARSTPVLVNPLEAVVEYLGPEYPFYFNSLAEAAAKAEDLALVLQTHKYLSRLKKRKEFTIEHFRESFAESEIYNSLDPLPLVRVPRSRTGL